jgi:membrane-associated phospholipid phosphatase
VRHAVSVTAFVSLIVVTPICAEAQAGALGSAVTQSAIPHLSGGRELTPVGAFALTNATGGIVSLGSGIALHFGIGASGTAPGLMQPQASWRGGILFDEGFRGAARISSVDGQEIARVLSDVMLLATMLQAAAVDAALVPLVQGDTDLAWQASFAHSLALGLTLTIGTGVKEAVGRARPYERECADDPQRPGCQDSDRFHSFYSGHTSMAFTSAGFSCAMHLSRSLYRDEVADGASCGASLAMASATGLLRILADRHYLTDVLVGAVLGFLVGYIVPLAVVPQRQVIDASITIEDDPEAEPIPDSPQGTWSVAPMLSPPGLAGAADDTTPGPQATPSTGSATAMGGGTVGLSVFGTF